MRFGDRGAAASVGGPLKASKRAPCILPIDTARVPSHRAYMHACGLGPDEDKQQRTK